MARFISRLKWKKGIKNDDDGVASGFKMCIIRDLFLLIRSILFNGLPRECLYIVIWPSPNMAVVISVLFLLWQAD